MATNFPASITYIKLRIAWYQVHKVWGYLSYRSVHVYTSIAWVRGEGCDLQCCMTAAAVAGYEVTDTLHGRSFQSTSALYFLNKKHSHKIIISNSEEKLSRISSLHTFLVFSWVDRAWTCIIPGAFDRILDDRYHPVTTAAVKRRRRAQTSPRTFHLHHYPPIGVHRVFWDIRTQCRILVYY